MNYSDLLKKIWHIIYDPATDVAHAVETYFHVDYEQCINGVILDRKQYIDHVIEQKRNMQINNIDYKHILENGNELFAIYYPSGMSVENLPIEGEVIAYFLFENSQIKKIHGQVRLIQGKLADVDME